MKVKVVGKQELQGTSKKTGNSYHMIFVYINSQANGVFGLRADRVTLDPSMVPFQSINVGLDYNIDFDQRGQVVGFSQVK